MVLVRKKVERRVESLSRVHGSARRALLRARTQRACVRMVAGGAGRPEPFEEGQETKPKKPSRLAARLFLVWYKKPTEEV